MTMHDRNLLKAAEKIKWPAKVDYLNNPSSERKDFENTFLNLLKLQELYVLSPSVMFYPYEKTLLGIHVKS